MTRPRRRGAAAWAAALLLAAPAFAADAPPPAQQRLEALLAQRFAGDRTGVCVVAALVEGAQVHRARHCAKPRDGGGPGFDDAFEIGSVTKTMTGFLVADLVAAGRWSLDDAIEQHLPAGTSVPRAGDRRITVRDIVTHSSGLPALPSRMHGADPADPYARLTEAELLASLGEARLLFAPGSRAAYSNFGMMVLSLAVARATGGDLERTLTERLFDPLQMRGAYVARRPPGSSVAAGHRQSGAPTAPWTIATNLAGIGMVRATLDDLVRYTHAHLGVTPTPLAGRLAATREPIVHGFGINWILPASGPAAGLALHDGGTGGFSSLVVLDPAVRRAVVLLADTTLTEVGGLGQTGLALLGRAASPGRPRREVPVPAALREAIAGEYRLAGMTMRIWPQGERLLAQTLGQDAFELFFDDHGDLFPKVVSARLAPYVEGGRVTRFQWFQGGGAVEGVRSGGAPR